MGIPILAFIRGQMERVPVNSGGGWSGAPLYEIFMALTSKVRSGVKISGVAFKNNSDFNRHLENIMDKSKIRLATLAKVAGAAWGLEAGSLRLTHEEEICSACVGILCV